MKIYTWQGEDCTSIPNPLRLEDGTMISPVSEEKFIELGGEVSDDGEPTPEEEFAEAAARFRALCDEIGQFIGDASFTGGFDEVVTFNSSTATQEDPMTAYALALRWMELNEECKYKGSKIGLGQPEWFYRAWELAAEERTEA